MPSEHNARYGIVHRKLRERWALAIASGGVDCARCGEPIPPGTPGDKWDLGHIDGTLKHAGPEHSRCNRQTITHAKEAARPTGPVLPTPETHPWLTFHPDNPHLSHTSRDW